MRAIFIAACFVAGGVISYYCEAFIYSNDDAVNIFTTVYTVLAGFLLAVITVLADPAMLPPRGWQSAENGRGEIERRLIRHAYLFAMYLVTLGVIFASTLLSKAPTAVVPDWVRHALSYAHLFLGVSAFLLTFGLPFMLIGIQRRRFDTETERRRLEEGIT